MRFINRQETEGMNAECVLLKRQIDSMHVRIELLEKMSGGGTKTKEGDLNNLIVKIEGLQEQVSPHLQC